MEVLYKDECYEIVGACFEVYNELGSGFLEAVYQKALKKELSFRKVPFIEQPKLEIQYKGSLLRQYYQPDFICFSKIILELKTAKLISDEHRAQTINYLKATGFKLALIGNFGNKNKLEYERIIF